MNVLDLDEAIVLKSQLEVRIDELAHGLRMIYLGDFNLAHFSLWGGEWTKVRYQDPEDEPFIF